MQNDERILNLASKFKLDKFWSICLAKNYRKLAKYPILPILTAFFLTKKGVRSYPIWIARSDLVSSHRFADFRHLFNVFFILIFWHPMHFQNIEIKFETPKNAWNRFFPAQLNSACLKPCETTWPAFNFQSWCFLNNPNAARHMLSGSFVHRYRQWCHLTHMKSSNLTFNEDKVKLWSSKAMFQINIF